MNAGWLWLQVCTFSSQICRIAYELLNTDHRDASLNFKSLDDIWFFAGQRDNIQLAVLDHTPQTADQIELRVGDEVKPAGNHWDGFSRGTNLRTNRHGLYPSFKVISRVETYKFPTYPEVKLPQRWKDLGFRSQKQNWKNTTYTKCKTAT